MIDPFDGRGRCLFWVSVVSEVIALLLTPMWIGSCSCVADLDASSLSAIKPVHCTAWTIQWNTTIATFWPVIYYKPNISHY